MLVCAPPPHTHTHMHMHTGEPPSLTSELQDTFVFREDAGGNPVNLQFECQAEGNPSPNITW